MIDEGLWTTHVYADGVYISSNDYIHDVHMKVDGDFRTHAQHLAYANNLCERLNKDADKCNVP